VIQLKVGVIAESWHFCPERLY